MVTYTTREPRHLLMSVQKEKNWGKRIKLLDKKEREEWASIVTED